MAKSTGKKGGRKIGRGKLSPAHIRYNGENRREKNKKRKLKKHLRKHPVDRTALEAVK